MVYLWLAIGTRIDGHLGVTLNQSGIPFCQATLTAAIDITHRGTAKLLIVNFGVTNLTAADLHIRAAIYLSQLTAAIDAGLDDTTSHADIGIGVAFSIDITTAMSLVTHAAAIDATEGVFQSLTVLNLSTDGTVSDDDFRFHIDVLVLSILGCMTASHSTKLTTTIDVTLDSTVADGQLRTLHITKLRPVINTCRVFTLTSGKHITAISMFYYAVCNIYIIIFITNGSTNDIDCGQATTISITHAGQLAATVDVTLHRTIAHVDSAIAFHQSRAYIIILSLTGTEYITCYGDTRITFCKINARISVTIISLFGTEIHLRTACDRSLFTATIDVTIDNSAQVLVCRTDVHRCTAIHFRR